jgi:DNA helicase-2/ATP-dependent DNA helicase PcrA
VRSYWGPNAVSWLHEVTTIDALIGRLITRLLRGGHIEWPGGHLTVEVSDSWKGQLAHSWRYAEPICGLEDRAVVVHDPSRPKKSNQPSLAHVKDCVTDGRCTHSDLRGIASDALRNPALRAQIVSYFAETTRALIVDEVFDGNELDLELVACAAEAGSDVSLVGDPWQALYEFRGATPKKVPEFIAQHPFETLPLTASRRWKTDAQRQLAASLRAGEAIELEAATEIVDVVIGRWWADIWRAGPPVLPLAFKSLSNDARDAAMCLLLGTATQLHLGLGAAGEMDALFSLRLEAEQSHELRGPLEAIIQALDPTRPQQAYDDLEQTLRAHGVHLPQARRSDLLDITALASCLTASKSPIPGLTSHQAKGREWDHVGLVLKQADVAALAAGLSVERPDDRALYVACTRARCSTTAWQEVP